MARRRTAAEQIGVPELDVQESTAAAAAEAELEAAQAAAAAEEAPAATEDPYEWVPDKFKKNPEKLAESYTQLERELQRRGETERQLQERMAQLEQQLSERESYDPDAAERFEEFYEQNPLEAMRYMAAQAAAEVMRGAMGQQAQANAPREQVQNELYAMSLDDLMEREYDDWSEIKPGIARLLQEDPSLLPESAFDSIRTTKRHMSTLYNSVKYEKLQEEQEQLRQQGVEQRGRDTARKLEAQTLSGASGRAPEPSEGEKELAKMRAAIASSSYSIHRAQEQHS